MNSAPTRLIIVRHGNTFSKGDTLLRVGKRTDLDLVEKEKGTRAGLFIKNGHFNITGAFSGPLKRHIQTTELISQVIGFDSSKIVIDERFNELDYGEHDGRPEAEIVHALGEDVLKKWDEFATPPSQWPVDVEAIKKNWQCFLNEAAEYPSGEDLLVVTSNGTIRFLPFLMDCDMSDLTLKVPTGGVVVLQKTTDNQWKIVQWGVKP